MSLTHNDALIVSAEQMAQLKADPDWIALPAETKAQVIEAPRSGFTIVPYSQWAAPKMNRAARRRMK